jgi:hypothetical protein
MLETGEHTSIREIAAAEKINESHVGRTGAAVTLLASEIVQSIVDGNQPPELQIKRRSSSMTLKWDDQCIILADSKTTAVQSNQDQR